MHHRISFTVNGELLEADVESRRTLLEVLRENLSLTGTKKGCEEGVCGACTVLMNGKPVSSCLVLAVEAQGKEILTIEGLADNGKFHPIQKAFIEYHGFQCGFCTPGMILSAKALLDQNPKPTDEEIKRALSGNLCRCSGGVQAIQAIKAVAKNSRRSKERKA